MNTRSPELEKLRQELDLVDEQILKQAVRRLELVEKIYQEKRKGETPLFNRERERMVYDQAKLVANRVGLDVQLADEIVRLLMEASHRTQEQAELRDVNAQESDQKKHFLIIGGQGQMGRRFSEAFVARGHRVLVVEKNDSLSEETVANADIVMICVPMQLASEIVTKIAPFVREDALLTDINSLKNEICTIYKKSCRGESLGLHPMFGPTVKRFWRQKMILVPVKSGELSKWFETELGRMGFELIETSAEDHDRMMAIIQVLTHFHTMVAGEAMKRSGIELKGTLPFMSPIYKLELAVIGRLFAQDPDLYAEIEMSNPKGKELREVFLKAASELEEIIRNGDREDFRKTFLSIRNYFQEFSNEALALSDMIIDNVVSRP